MNESPSVQHKAVIVSDQPINLVNVIDSSGTRWFRLFASIVESGTWARLSDSSRNIYVVLAKHCGERWLAWPSIATIGNLSGLKRRTILYAVKELEGEGLLVRRHRGGGRQSTTYELLDTAATPSLPFQVREKSAVHHRAPELDQ